MIRKNVWNSGSPNRIILQYCRGIAICPRDPHSHCRTERHSAKVIGVEEWNRADLEDQYVFLFLDDHTDAANQHPSFKGRVDLQDRQMKDGDVSLILTNVNINDTGTYECRIKTGTNRKRRAHLKTDPISIIYLSVVDPPGE
ncbi:programmed cell death 1 ligand 1 [Haplochromis burtoni]|uniref:programmed cell death 1 ligand 1 n=1 Tax=Haplochromis burtoni TaxID=8153 RepID=UPI0006C97745|nr:programmed cell death 1 ligand 1 [Haplochromis burtoni]